MPPRRKSSYPLQPSLRDLLDEPTDHDRVSASFRRRSNCLCWSREPIRGTWNFTLIGPGTGDCAVRKLCRQKTVPSGNCAIRKTVPSGGHAGKAALPAGELGTPGHPCWQGISASQAPLPAGPPDSTIPASMPPCQQGSGRPQIPCWQGHSTSTVPDSTIPASKPSCQQCLLSSYAA